VKYTLVLDMLFKEKHLTKIYKTNIILFIIMVFSLIYFSDITNAQINDRVIAYIMDNAITLSEFNEVYEKTKKVSPEITKEEVINTMINRILLINEAKKIGLTASDDDNLLKEYIDIKIKTFIQIKDEEIEQFYENNITEFKDKTLDDVKDEIENYLIEKELNKLLKKHIEELREKSCIKIQLE